MNLLYNPIFLNHDTGAHPENRQRLAQFNNLPEAPLVDGRPFLELIHSANYVRLVKEAAQHSLALDGDTLTSVGSFEAAYNAVGLTIAASESNDFALVRPPGHHAYPTRGSGFCLFNNIAIAVQKLVSEGKRVAIFDFDGHLGDGTEAIFYNTDQVLFWSTHQYPAFPGNGFVDEIGEGQGKGFTINVPLPPGSGDDVFLNAFDHFLPIVEQFQPDVVAISAGFDAHQLDPLLQLRFSASAFYKIGWMLSERFPRIFATLEGGYNLEALKKSIYNFQAGINHAPMPFEEVPTTSHRSVWETYEAYVQAVMGKLAAYWKF